MVDHISQDLSISETKSHLLTKHRQQLRCYITNDHTQSYKFRSIFLQLMAAGGRGLISLQAVGGFPMITVIPAVSLSFHVYCESCNSLNRKKRLQACRSGWWLLIIHLRFEEEASLKSIYSQPINSKIWFSPEVEKIDSLYTLKAFSTQGFNSKYNFFIEVNQCLSSRFGFCCSAVASSWWQWWASWIFTSIPTSPAIRDRNVFSEYSGSTSQPSASKVQLDSKWIHHEWRIDTSVIS